MALADILRMAIISSDANNQNQVVNVMYFKQTDVLVFDTPEQDLSLRWLDECLDAYRACFTASYAVKLLQVRRLVTPPTGLDLPVTGGTGLMVSGDNLPRQIAPVITWRTDFIGRSYRGRTYMPPVTEAFQNDGLLNSTLLANMDTYAQAVLDLNTINLSYSSWELQVHSTVQKGVKLTVPVNTPVSGFTSQSIVGVQRRRRFGIGV